MIEIPHSWPALGVAYLPLAHLMHWYFMPLYALPVLLVLGSAIATAIRERRADRQKPRRARGHAP